MLNIDQMFKRDVLGGIRVFYNTVRSGKTNHSSCDSWVLEDVWEYTDFGF